MKVDARHQLRRRHIGEQLPHRLAFSLRVKIPHRVDDSREREMNDALLGTEPAQLRFAREAVPEPAEVRRDVVEVAADDQMPERFDGGCAHFVAAADRKRQAVPFEPAVGLRG